MWLSWTRALPSVNNSTGRMEEDYKHGSHFPRERTIAKGPADVSAITTHFSEEDLIKFAQYLRDHLTEEELRHLEGCDECSEVLSLFVRRCIHGLIRVNGQWLPVESAAAPKALTTGN